MATHTIKYQDIDFTVEGSFIKGEESTRYHPGYPDEFEIENIFISDQDVTQLLTEDSIRELEQLVFEKYYQ